jgi:hypothetical protein
VCGAAGLVPYGSVRMALFHCLRMALFHCLHCFVSGLHHRPVCGWAARVFQKHFVAWVWSNRAAVQRAAGCCLARLVVWCPTALTDPRY